MAAAVPAWGRSASRRIWRPICRATRWSHGVNPAAGRDQSHGPGVIGTLGLGVDPADLLDLYRHDGRRGPHAGDDHGDPQRQLHRAGASHRIFPIVYSGPGGFIAHECIIDLRWLKERTGLSVEDVAKRLVDYGFHAPTMSFPVVDTLMIEPTESKASASSTASATR